jgi:RNA polymerase sigma-70 factor (ECF subfamily)
MSEPEAPLPVRSGLEHLTDAQLVHLYVGGRQGSMDVLLRRYSGDLLRFCRSLMRSPQDADDVHQETLLRAVHSLHTLRNPGQFRSWLFSIARNLAMSFYRAQKRLCPMPTDDAVIGTVEGVGPEEFVEAREEYQTVAQALARLGTSHQTVLLMREVEGLSYADIAQRLNVSKGAVETLLFRARRRLRREYGRAYREPAGSAA